jgi:biotin operon repressor
MSAATPTADSVVVMIPLKLRLKWVDQMSTDVGLSHLAFRLGCLIGTHLNKCTGHTFVSAERLARLMRCSLRTVWSAISELKDLGYIVVTHRRGRGRSNEYWPAIEGVAIIEKRAAGCTASAAENVQLDVGKRAADYTDASPTGSLNPDINPRRARPSDGGARVFVSRSDPLWLPLERRLREERGRPVPLDQRGTDTGWWFSREWVEDLTSGTETDSAERASASQGSNK